MSDMREIVARAVCCPSGVCSGEAIGRECEAVPWETDKADAALAVIREELARRVPEATGTWALDANTGFNACRAAMLSALGGRNG